MKSLGILLVLGMFCFSAYAAETGQTQGSTSDSSSGDKSITFEIAGVDLSNILTTMTDSLKAVGLIPDLSASCDGQGVDCNPLSTDKTRAFFIILLLVFMAFSVVIGLSSIPSAVMAFFITSFLFNKLPIIFTSSSAQGIFQYVFSALFIFIWTDYLLQYMWAISPTTRLLLVSSITLISLFFMGIEAVYQRIEWMLTFFMGQLGFTMFFLFTIAMHFFNTFVSLTSVKAVRNFRKGGSVAVQNINKDMEKEFQAGRLK